MTYTVERGHEISYMNVWSLYRPVATVARELARYDLDLVGVREVRWEKWGTVRAGGYIFFYGKGDENSVRTF
jgi:hypothetical protein